MKDYVLNKKPEPASNELVWAFDLGKGFHGDSPSPRWGEGVRRTDEVNTTPKFLQQGIPALARRSETKAAHPGGICRNQNRRRSPPDVAHATGAQGPRALERLIQTAVRSRQTAKN
jgi:hypothetical protein